MSKWIMTICIFLICTQIFAQQEEREKALESYGKTDYAVSIQHLLQLENKGLGDFETKIILAQSFYAQRDFKSALEWLEKAAKINTLSDKYQVLLAQLYKNNENYPAADSIYIKLGNAYSNQVSGNLRNIEKSNFEVFSISNLNTSGDEFSPTYYRDGIVFVANAKRKRSLFKWNNRPWLKLYYLPYKPTGVENGQWQELKLPKVNNFHAGPVAFTRQDQMIYFSHSQNLERKSKAKVDEIGIYSSKKYNNKWDKVQPISLNNPTFSIAHPAISANGNEMYFVSDMPGGYGGTDIYYTKMTGSGWMKPINLGSSINTPKNELFPFIHDDNTLYFASEGHDGFGGIDIFYSTYENGAWSKPINMGQPVNSGYDDFGLILDKNKTNGYLSSNRKGGAGQDDIYRLVSKDYINQQNQVKVFGSITDKNSGDFIKNGRVSIIDQNQKKWETQTDHLGYFEFKLPSNTLKIQLIASQTGYFPVESQLDVSNYKSIQKNMELQKIEIDKSIIIPNIYYDFDKADLNAPAISELNKLLLLLNENPTWIIEISSHTDSRADAAYNLKLSEKRAQNVVKYLISKGISKDRLYPKGYGEERLLNGCADNVKCSEEEHALNRRTEFKLIGFEEATHDSIKSPVLFSKDYSDKNDLQYKIQIGVFRAPNEKWLNQFNDLGKVEYFQRESNGLYNVYLASYPNYNVAKIYLEKARLRGLEDAFIVAFYQGKPISLEEAEKWMKK